MNELFKKLLLIRFEALGEYEREAVIKVLKNQETEGPDFILAADFFLESIIIFNTFKEISEILKLEK